MQIDITGLHQADVLFVLYCHAISLGTSPAMMMLKTRISSSETQKQLVQEATRLIAEGKTRFDHVDLGLGPIPLKVAFTEQSTFNASAFDKKYGGGQAHKAIVTLRCKYQEEMECLAPDSALSQFLQTASAVGEMKDEQKPTVILSNIRKKRSLGDESEKNLLSQPAHKQKKSIKPRPSPLSLS